jgi:hypothetical protein
VIAFRHCDSRLPFLWTSATQPSARWHGPSEGPANYFADTPVGAWAEFLRHEGITDAADLAGVERSLWAVEIPEDGYEEPALLDVVLKGDVGTYPSCQSEAKRLRALGATRIEAPSAALVSGGASGWVVDPLISNSSSSGEGRVFVLYGPQPSLVGWPTVEAGSPPERILAFVQHL